MNANTKPLGNALAEGTVRATNRGSMKFHKNFGIDELDENKTRKTLQSIKCNCLLWIRADIVKMKCSTCFLHVHNEDCACV